MTKLLLASLLSLAASTPTTSHAEPDIMRLPIRPMPPKPNVCTAGQPGDRPVIEIDHQSDYTGKNATSLVLYANGEWTYTEQRDGRMFRTASGCADRGRVARLDATLATAPWDISHAEIVCAAISAESDTYRVFGHATITRTMCDGLILDPKSEKALAAATNLVDSMLPTWK